jgi:hypothetical protein
MKLKTGEDGSTTPRSVSSGSVRDPRQRIVDDEGGAETGPRRKSSLA